MSIFIMVATVALAAGLAADTHMVVTKITGHELAGMVSSLAAFLCPHGPLAHLAMAAFERTPSVIIRRAVAADRAVLLTEARL
jgi:hypothetical protein